MAQVTAVYSTLGAVGSAFGAAISAGVWTSKEPLSLCIYARGHLLTTLRLDVLPQKLLQNLPSYLLPQLEDIEDSVEVALSFDWGTPERIAINLSYDQTMRILLITATACEAISLLLSLCMDDLNVKTLDETRDYGGVVIGKSGAVEAIKEQIRGARDDAPDAKESE
jgi:hypothetical protein